MLRIIVLRRIFVHRREEVKGGQNIAIWEAA